MKRFKSNKKNIKSTLYNKLYLTSSGPKFYRIDPNSIRKIKYWSHNIYCNSEFMGAYQEFIKNNKYNKIDYITLAKAFNHKKEWNICTIYNMRLVHSSKYHYDEFYYRKRLNCRKRKKIIKQLLIINLKMVYNSIINKDVLSNSNYAFANSLYDYGQFFYF